MLVVALLSAVSCSKQEQPVWSSDRIAFRAGGPGVDLDIRTRTVSETTAATLESSGFYVSAVTGSAGSESSVWNSASFTKDGTYFEGDKYWPNSNPSYKFYASSLAITYAAAGSTVNASNTSDVVCSYMASPTYMSPNTFIFEHIFARIGDVTVSALDGYTITGVSVSITPKTGGVYNMRTGSGQSDGTGWSSLTTGSATNIANATPGTKSNDLYLVPGNYDIAFSWTASKGGYSEAQSRTIKNVAVTGGKVNSFSAGLTGSASEIEFGVSITPWTGNAVAMGEVMAIEEGTFGGLYIAQGNMYYDGSQFRIADDWTYHSNSLAMGLNRSSSFFYWDECHDANVDGWRLPTRSEWQTILTTSSAVRPGSTVNGVVNKHWAVIELPDYYYTDGLLVFPDGKSLYGYNLGVMDDSSDLILIDVSILNEYLQQGCIFLPAFGYWEDVMDWVTDFNQSYYYSSTEKGEYTAYGIEVSDTYSGETNLDKYSGFLVRLVKEAPKVYSFGGLEIAPGNLYWNGSAWSIDEAWDSHDTYGTAYGVNSGVPSTYFSFMNMGALFESSGFTKNDGDIENLLNPLDGWRLPTLSELEMLFTNDESVRPGSSVWSDYNMDYCIAHWVPVGGDIEDGVIIFPDGETFENGYGLFGELFDNEEGFESLTEGNLASLIEDGCIYIPSKSYIPDYDGWIEFANGYWSSTSDYKHESCVFLFEPSNPSCMITTIDKEENYFLVRLVRPIE